MGSSVPFAFAMAALITGRLTGTAYLHSVMIQQRRGMLKVWNIALIITTFALTIFGTFLTRSGVLASVHTFGASAVGPLFIGLLIFLVIGLVSLLWCRLPQLQSDHELDSLISRESSFLLNNLLLVGGCVCCLLGNRFPSDDHITKGNPMKGIARPAVAGVILGAAPAAHECDAIERQVAGIRPARAMVGAEVRVPDI